VQLRSNLKAIPGKLIEQFANDSVNENPCFNKTDIRPAAEETLKKLAAIIRAKSKCFCAISLNGACSQRLPSHNNNESR
jgi:hypothetical protein